MITEDYVSFEIAKLLKEKGFNWEVRFVYHSYKQPFFHRTPKDFNGEEYKNLKHEWYSCPTQAMVMKWLREKFHLALDVYVTKGPDWCTIVKLFDKFGNTIKQPYNDWTKHYSTYEESCEAAIKYCLENLI